MSESGEQKAYFLWVRLMEKQDSRYSMIMATPNQGWKDGEKWGKQRKNEGMAKGFPDISILIPSQGYHGAFIEMKIGKNKPTSNQMDWLFRLDHYGYKAVVAYGFKGAKQFTEWYLEDNDEIEKTK